jgi:hypothetical protein
MSFTSVGLFEILFYLSFFFTKLRLFEFDEEANASFDLLLSFTMSE